MTNRRRGGKHRKKTPAQKRRLHAQEAARNNILAIQRPTMHPLTVAVKVELAAQAAESRAKK